MVVVLAHFMSLQPSDYDSQGIELTDCKHSTLLWCTAIEYMDGLLKHRIPDSCPSE